MNIRTFREIKKGAKNMNEIKCPHCHKVFTVDESSYADILSQVRIKEFNEKFMKNWNKLKISIKVN